MKEIYAIPNYVIPQDGQEGCSPGHWGCLATTVNSSNTEVKEHFIIPQKTLFDLMEGKVDYLSSSLYRLIGYKSGGSGIGTAIVEKVRDCGIKKNVYPQMLDWLNKDSEDCSDLEKMAVLDENYRVTGQRDTVRIRDISKPVQVYRQQ